MLIKILTLVFVSRFYFTIPNPSDRLGELGKPPSSQVKCATILSTKYDMVGCGTNFKTNQILIELLKGLLKPQQGLLKES